MPVAGNGPISQAAPDMTHWRSGTQTKFNFSGKHKYLYIHAKSEHPYKGIFMHRTASCKHMSHRTHPNKQLHQPDDSILMATHAGTTAAIKVGPMSNK
jgi:hypothetical protein